VMPASITSASTTTTRCRVSTTLDDVEATDHGP
jgi:hypothetical protein